LKRHFANNKEASSYSLRAPGFEKLPLKLIQKTICLKIDQSSGSKKLNSQPLFKVIHVKRAIGETYKQKSMPAGEFM